MATTLKPDITTAELLFCLASVREQIARYEALLGPLREEEATYRSALQDLMQRAGAKTVEGHGLQAVRSSRKSVVVVDEVALINHITDTGRESRYVKFDLIAARKDAAKHGWPGVEEVFADVLSIREGK